MSKSRAQCALWGEFGMFLCLSNLSLMFLCRPACNIYWISLFNKNTLIMIAIINRSRNLWKGGDSAINFCDLSKISGSISILKTHWISIRYTSFIKKWNDQKSRGFRRWSISWLTPLVHPSTLRSQICHEGNKLTKYLCISWFVMSAIVWGARTPSPVIRSAVHFTLVRKTNGLTMCFILILMHWSLAF